MVDIPGQKLPSIANGDMAKYLKSVMAPQVPHELTDAFIRAVEEGNIRTMPIRRMAASCHSTPGSLLIGDAFNMRHPLAGGGMTVALSDIVVLRDLLRPLPDFNDANALCHYLERFYTLRKGLDMDLETENRIAAVLLKEAAELRRQAQSEGALAYLHRPNVRGRPNSRFLTATVLGVQQANRAVEVNEMWKLRQKELELDDRLKGRSADENSDPKCHSVSVSERRSCERDTDPGTSGSRKRDNQDSHSSEDEGLRDAEIEKFLQSRVKRGRGTVGSRMDEAGPYLPSCPDPRERESASPDMKLGKGRGNQVVIGPEKPVWLNSPGSSENESLSDDETKVRKKAKSSKHHHHHSRKHRSKKKSKDKEDKKRRKEEKRVKRHR